MPHCSIVPYCTLLYLTARYSAILHLTAPDCTLLHLSTLWCTLLYLAAPNCTLLHLTASYCTLLHLTAPDRPSLLYLTGLLHLTVLHIQ